MAPGLLSTSAHMDECDNDQIVAIYAEGKKHAVGIGLMLMSVEDIRTQKKGHAIENVHHLNDGLWHLREFRKK